VGRNEVTTVRRPNLKEVSRNRWPALIAGTLAALTVVVDTASFQENPTFMLGFGFGRFLCLWLTFILIFWILKWIGYLSQKFFPGNP
jgi:hypothetical protein